MPAGDVEMRHRDADKADHRANRKVNTAGKDDKGGADGRNDDECVVGEDVAEHQRGEEIIVKQAAGYEENHKYGDRRRQGQDISRSSLPPGEGGNQRGSGIGRLQQQHDQDDDRFDHEVVFWRQSAGQDRRRQGLNDQGAEDRAAEIHATSRERAAADDDGKDRIEFDVEALAHRVGRVGVSGEDDPGGCGANP